MKKIILSALAIATLQFAQAQQTQPAVGAGQQTQRQQVTPEQRATRDATHLQKVLTLTDEQKQKIYQAALTRTNAMQQIKGESNANKKSMHAEAKPVKEQFVKDVNLALTPEQQQKWEAYRLEQKQKHQQNKAQNAPANGNTAPVAAPTKLEPQDDGMKD
ncbi:MAG: hypothetical protein ABI448_06115 [Bacteroidia bacterium]